MNTAYQKKWPLYLSTKNTILKKYDGRYAVTCWTFFSLLILLHFCCKLNYQSPSCTFVCERERYRERNGVLLYDFL